MNNCFKYWVETSDTLGRFFLERGAHPLPGTMAATLLGLESGAVELSKGDQVHYTRDFKHHLDIPCTKMILAMEDESVFQAGLEAIEKNYLFIPWVIMTYDPSNPYGLLYSLDQAVAITENIYRENEENRIDEMPPSWGEALGECLKTFKMYRKEQPEIGYTEDYIEYCEYLFAVMPPLELHEIETKSDDKMEKLNVYGKMTLVKGDNGKYGLCNPWGVMKQPCVFDKIVWKEGGFWTYMDGLMGCVDDQDGDTMVSCRWKKVEDMEDYYFKVMDESGKWGAVSDADEQLLPCVWEDIKTGIGHLDHDQYIVKDASGQWGVVEADGYRMIPCLWNEITDDTRYYIVKDSNGKYGIYDEYGQQLSGCRWKAIEKQMNYRREILVQDDSGRWGVLDSEGMKVSPCIWKSIKLEGGWMIVTGTDNLTGLLDKKGERVIPCRYKALKPKNKQMDGIIVVDKEGKYGYYNKKVTASQPGSPLEESFELNVPCRWAGIDFGFGALIVRDSDGRYGVIKSDGSEVIPCRWKMIRHKYGHYYEVQSDNSLWGAIDFQGKIVLEPEWNDMRGGFFCLYVKDKNSKWGMLDRDGKMVIECKWNTIEDMGDFVVVSQRKNKYGIFNRDGKQISTCRWSYVQQNSIGLIVKNEEGKVSMLGTDGKVLIPCRWKQIRPISGLRITNRYAVQDWRSANGKDRLWGLVDLYGKMLHKCEWIEWHGGIGGIIFVQNTEGLWGIIDNNGKEVTPCKWKFASMPTETLILVTDLQGKQGLLDWDGKEVLPCKWRTVRAVESSWPVIVEDDDHRWGALDLSTGEFHIPLQWKRLEYQDWACRFLVMDDGHRWGALDNFGKTLLPCTFLSASALKNALDKIDKEKNTEEKED